MKAIRIFLIFFLVSTFFWQVANAQKQFKVLLVTTTRGWHHESLHSGVLAIQELGKKFL